MTYQGSSKTTVPQVFHKILPRDGIIQILDSISFSEAVCLVAPYGCGKTLAVLSWLQARDLEAAWVTLSAEDGSETAFLGSLTTALLSFNNELETFSSCPEYADNPHAFIREAVSRMGPDNAKILVIDNFHFIKDMKLLCFIKDFIYSLLGDWRVIIISRAELPPVFNDLILKQHICLITIKELGFSPEEVADYFNTNGYDVSWHDAMQIHKETEGWPAALNVIMTLSRDGPVSYGEDARAYISDFFETEIWTSLDEYTKVFLLRTSLLETLTPSSCHAVTEMRAAALPILKWLFANGLFISKLDEENAYQYHSVFKCFLLAKLDSSAIDKQELYRKIAWWLYERDEFARSFPYFFKAGDLYGISQVFSHLNLANMGIEGFLELTSCITTLEVKDLKPYPVIIARMALINYLLGDITEMQRLYGFFLEWTEPGELPISPDEYGEYLWEAGWLSYLNPDEPVRRNKKHEEWTNYKEYVPHLKSLHTSRSAVLKLPTMLRGVRDYCSVVDAIDEFVRWNETTGRSVIREETSIYEMDLIRAEYAYEIEDFKKTGQLLSNIMPFAENQKITDLYFVGLALLVKLNRAIHDPQSIDKLSDHLEAMILENGATFLLPNFHAFQQRNWLLGGRTGFIDVFERENKDYVSKPHYYLLYRHMAYARGLLSTRSFNEALLILGNLDILCRKYKRTMDMMEVNSLRAIAFYGLGNEDGARRSLTEALEEAKKYGFIRIFSDDAKELWPILELVNGQMTDMYVRNIITSCKKTLAWSGIKPSAKNSAHAGLTKTELNILKALKIGMSYEEIALDNNIKISTVKSHAHSIYSKLEVNNRVSAVMAAQNVGILD